MAKSKTKEMGKHLLARKVSNSVGSVATISRQVNYSPNHVSHFAGETGKVLAFDLGDGEADEMIVQLEVAITTGEKTKRRTIQTVWVHALDVLELTS
jgi:hypothetical protein